MAKRLESTWAYLVEILAAGFLLVALDMLVGVHQLALWLGHQQANLTLLLTIGAAATALTFGAFITLLTTDFGAAIRKFRVAKLYTVAFAFPLLLFVATVALVAIGNGGWGALYEEICIFLLIYSTINFITMVKNVIDLVGLWQDFDNAKKYGRTPNDP